MKTDDDGLAPFDAREDLRRLGDALAGPPPDEEESRRMCAEVGIDLDALYAGVMAQVRAHEGRAAEEEAPASGPRAKDGSAGARLGAGGAGRAGRLPAGRAEAEPLAGGGGGRRDRGGGGGRGARDAREGAAGAARGRGGAERVGDGGGACAAWAGAERRG